VLGLDFALTAQTKRRGCPPDFADPVVREHSSCESDQHRSYGATATSIASPTPSTRGARKRDACADRAASHRSLPTSVAVAASALTTVGARLGPQCAARAAAGTSSCVGPADAAGPSQACPRGSRRRHARHQVASSLACTLVRSICRHQCYRSGLVVRLLGLSCERRPGTTRVPQQRPSSRQTGRRRRPSSPRP